MYILLCLINTVYKNVVQVSFSALLLTFLCETLICNKQNQKYVLSVFIFPKNNQIKIISLKNCNIQGKFFLQDFNSLLILPFHLGLLRSTQMYTVLPKTPNVLLLTLYFSHSIDHFQSAKKPFLCIIFTVFALECKLSIDYCPLIIEQL